MTALITASNGSRQPMFLVVLSIFLSLSYTAVALRLYCRSLTRGYGLDDFFAVASLAAITALAIMNIFHVSLGTGQHTKNLPLLEILTPTLKHWYSYQIVYPFALYLVKGVILATYRRIFVDDRFRLKLWATAALITVQTIVVMFVQAFECHTEPQRAWSPTFPKGCNSLPASYYSMSSVNIFTDIVILMLPMSSLWRLQLNTKKKLALIGIFSVGSISIIASAMRFYALYTYVNTKDVAYDAIYILLWSQIEINIALISASAPALRPLFKKTFGSSGGASSFTPYGGTNAYARSQRGGPLELHSYRGRNETVVAKGDHDQGSHSSQEHLTRKIAGQNSIVKTVETTITSEADIKDSISGHN